MSNREKAVRDGIEALEPARCRRAGEGEWGGLLLEKLREEWGEVEAACMGLPIVDVLAELADLVEVSYALAAHHGADLGAYRRGKAEARGVFRNRIVLAMRQESGAQNVEP